MFTVGFYIPLKQMMGALADGMSSYAQYLMPLIALQAIAFASLSAAFRSATDSVLGINRRFKSMPIALLTPPASRMSASMYRCSIALGGLAGVWSCHRVPVLRRLGAHRGLLRPGAAHRCGAVLPGGLIGAATENPEATAPLMLLPQLILGCLSVGVATGRTVSFLDPTLRQEPTGIPGSLCATRVGRGQHAFGRFGELVCDRPDPALGRGLRNRSASVPRSSCLSAAMMVVASADNTTVTRGGLGDERPVVERDFAENSLRRLVPHTWVLTARLLRRWRRDRAAVLESVAMPVVLLVTLHIVLDDGISQVTGHSALYGSVPLIAMVAAMSGSMVGGIGLMRERSDGFLSRLWVVPMHRASGLLSRLAADGVRIVVTTAVILCAGLVMGFRFHQGFLASVAFVFVPTVFGLAFTVIVITLALYAANTLVVEGTEVIWGMLMFFSSGFVPLDQFPRWIQPVVQHQPVSYSVEAMRGLSLGGPVLAPAVGMLLWSAGIVAVCAIPMAVGHRRASMRG